MGEVDPAFILATEHRPKLSVTEDEGIPLIDLSSMLDPTPDAHAYDELVGKIGDACKTWGFFQVINHGVPLDRRLRLESAMREFFALSKEEKLKVQRDEVNPVGYHNSEHTKNVKDWKEVLDLTVKDPILIPTSLDPKDEGLHELANQWPKHPPQLREAFEEYAEAMGELSFKLLELISLSLGLLSERLNGFYKEETSFVRLNHYPPCPVPDLALGSGHHTDAGVITILGEDDVGGLEVKRKSDGEWIRVKYVPNSYVVNIGDVIQVWSNDKYESVEHRAVVNSESDRYSIPFFSNPAHYVMVEPLEELITEKSPTKYRAYNFGKFFFSRFYGNFKKRAIENLQISQFKLAEG